MSAFPPVHDHNNPYPEYHRLQRRHPVAPTSMGSGVWLVSRYADVSSVLKSPEFSADRRLARARVRVEIGRIGAGPLMGVSTMLTSDDAEHMRLRALAAEIFHAHALTPTIGHVEQIVNELLDAIASRNSFDLIDDLASPLPTRVIAHLLGVPSSDWPAFRKWSDDIVCTLDPFASRDAFARADESAGELREYLRSAIASAERGLLYDLNSRSGQDGLTPEELIDTCLLLLIAGNETTTSLVGNGVLTLLRFPDQLGQLRAAPHLIEPAIEEILRYESPIQATMRVAKSEVHVDRRTIRAGDVLIALIGAANRDPSQFDRPDDFIIKRADNRHIAFGNGSHYCIGSGLARLEGRLAIAAILRRYPRLRLADPEPEWRRLFTLRSLSSLVVEVS